MTTRDKDSSVVLTDDLIARLWNYAAEPGKLDHRKALSLIIEAAEALAAASRPPQELEAQRDELLVALTLVVDHFGPWHDESCPGDDTCDCSAKPIHDAVNGAIRRAERAKRECASPAAPPPWQPMLIAFLAQLRECPRPSGDELPAGMDMTTFREASHIIADQLEEALREPASADVLTPDKAAEIDWVLAFAADEFQRVGYVREDLTPTAMRELFNAWKQKQKPLPSPPASAPQPVEHETHDDAVATKEGTMAEPQWCPCPGQCDYPHCVDADSEYVDEDCVAAVSAALVASAPAPQEEQP